MEGKIRFNTKHPVHLTSNVVLETLKRGDEQKVAKVAKKTEFKADDLRSRQYSYTEIVSERQHLAALASRRSFLRNKLIITRVVC